MGGCRGIPPIDPLARLPDWAELLESLPVSERRGHWFLDDFATKLLVFVSWFAVLLGKFPSNVGFDYMIR